MILTAHIAIAFISIITSVVAAFTPSKKLLRTSLVSTSLTVASGVALAFTQNISLGHLCTSGLAVVGLCGALIYKGYDKLAAAKN